MKPHSIATDDWKNLRIHSEINAFIRRYAVVLQGWRLCRRFEPELYTIRWRTRWQLHREDVISLPAARSRDPRRNAITVRERATLAPPTQRATATLSIWSEVYEEKTGASCHTGEKCLNPLMDKNSPQTSLTFSNAPALTKHFVFNCTVCFPGIYD